jgi:hypothetical protein
LERESRWERLKNMHKTGIHPSIHPSTTNLHDGMGIASILAPRNHIAKGMVHIYRHAAVHCPIYLYYTHFFNANEHALYNTNCIIESIQIRNGTNHMI